MGWTTGGADGFDSSLVACWCNRNADTAVGKGLHPPRHRVNRGHQQADILSIGGEPGGGYLELKVNARKIHRDMAGGSSVTTLSCHADSSLRNQVGSAAESCERTEVKTFGDTVDRPRT